MKAKIYKWSAWTTETRADVLYSVCRARIVESGFKIMDECTAFFSPHGFTAMFLLAESHFAIHTFPEENASYLELSSCCKNQYDAWVKGAYGMKFMDMQKGISEVE